MTIKLVKLLEKIIHTTTAKYFGGLIKKIINRVVMKNYLIDFFKNKTASDLKFYSSHQKILVQ